MTLEEYKVQTKEIMDEMNSFQGDDEQLKKLLEDLAKKYPELNEFNQKAMECQDLESFVEFAKSYGMEFSSEESSKILFDSLKKASGALTKFTGELDDEALDTVTGGGFFGKAWAAIKHGAGMAALTVISPVIATGVVIGEKEAVKEYFEIIKDGWTDWDDVKKA